MYYSGSGQVVYVDNSSDPVTHEDPALKAIDQCEAIPSSKGGNVAFLAETIEVCVISDLCVLLKICPDPNASIGNTWSVYACIGCLIWSFVM